MTPRENIHQRPLISLIEEWSKELGFQQVGISDGNLQAYESHLQQWLARGYHGEMAYMARYGNKRSRPSELVPGTHSVIVVRMNYLPPSADMGKQLQQRDKAYVSRYALGRDYHKLIRRRLQQLAEKIAGVVPDFSYRPFTDSAPVMEKPLAEQAGLGWIGKNTNLLSRDAGSWFFLGTLFTNLNVDDFYKPYKDSQEHLEENELQDRNHRENGGVSRKDDIRGKTERKGGVYKQVNNDLERAFNKVDHLYRKPQNKSHCGSCTACLDICPTQAFIGPYQLDASRCISYLTIELRGSIPEALRPLIGNRIYGCDDCQIVCPWNRFAKITAEKDFHPRHGLDQSDLITLFAWSETEFLEKTRGSAIRRIGHECWLRNIAVALGNSPTSPTVIDALLTRTNHTSEMVREHVQWALQKQGKNPQKTPENR